MLMRTVGKLGEVRFKARNWGKKSVIIPWVKIKQGSALVLKKLLWFNVKIQNLNIKIQNTNVKIQNTTAKMIKNLEEHEISDK